MSGDPMEDPVPRRLRRVANVVLALCALSVLVGFLPGIDVYKDRNDCVGQAFGRLFDWHHSGERTPCERDDVLVRTDPAGGLPLVAGMLPIVLGAVLVRRWPRLWVASLWPLMILAAAVIFFVATFELDLFSAYREVPRWPVKILSTLVGSIAAILLVVQVVAPTVGVIRWFRRRRLARAAEPVPLAEARVVRTGD